MQKLLHSVAVKYFNTEIHTLPKLYSLYSNFFSPRVRMLSSYL